MTFMPSHSSVNGMLLPDHVMVLLDDDTYQDVAANEYLAAEFARVKPKTADSSIAGQYSTLGLAGSSTLLELFVGKVPGPRRYTAGMVFSFEVPGAVPLARQTLAEQAGIMAHYQLVERGAADGGQSPWYHLLAPDLGADSPLLLMLNQVTPEYYTSIGAQPGPEGQLQRNEYLDAVVGDVGGDRRLSDLVGVTVRMRQERAEKLTTVLTTLGYQARGADLVGPEFTVTIDVAGAEPEGVTEVAMAVTKAPGGDQEFKFGAGSRLVIGTDGLARWSFAPVE